MPESTLSPSQELRIWPQGSVWKQGFPQKNEPEPDLSFFSFYLCGYNQSFQRPHSSRFTSAETHNEMQGCQQKYLGHTAWMGQETIFGYWDKVFIHCKKRFAIFPSPAGMSLTRLSLGGNIPAQGEFSQWHPGWGRENRLNFFTV